MLRPVAASNGESGNRMSLLDIHRRAPSAWRAGIGGAALGFVGAVLWAFPAPLDASVTGLVPARTGGFGEMTCHQCHWDNPLNDPAGRLTLDGVPDVYTPGEQYLITVMLARPGTGRAGFQLAAREDGINMNSGSDAGLLQPGDGTSETVHDDAKRVTYLQHSPAAAEVTTSGAATWKFRWTAPTEGPVAFHVAANAANGDDSPLGDYVYTASAHSRPE